MIYKNIQKDNGIIVRYLSSRMDIWNTEIYTRNEDNTYIWSVCRQNSDYN